MRRKAFYFDTLLYQYIYLTNLRKQFMSDGEPAQQFFQTLMGEVPPLTEEEIQAHAVEGIPDWGGGRSGEAAATLRLS